MPKRKESDRRKHLVNRLTAFSINVESLPEDFTLDKKIDRALDKLEARMKHHNATINYRKALGERRRARALEHAEMERLAELEAEQAESDVMPIAEREPTPPEIVNDAPGLRNVETA